MRGVTLFEVADDQIVAGRLYMEDVERDVAGIEQAVAIQPEWPGVLGVRVAAGTSGWRQACRFDSGRRLW